MWVWGAEGASVKALWDNAAGQPRSSESTLADGSADRSTYLLAFAELQRSMEQMEMLLCRGEDGDASLSRPVSFSSFNEASPAETLREGLESPIRLGHSLLTVLLACAHPPGFPFFLILCCKSWI